MKADFMIKTEKIIAEIRTMTCIDDVAAEVIKDILQVALKEHRDELDEYYWDTYYKAINTARNSAYDSAYDSGYEDGYDAGFDDGQSGNNYAE